MRATFQFTCDPPSARLRIAGELDSDADDELEDVLESLEGGGCTQIEIDLDALTYVDAAALDLLRHEQRRLRMIGGDLRVIAASPWYTLACRQAELDTLRPQPAPPARPRILRAGHELPVRHHD